jgi:hypothetical protein
MKLAKLIVTGVVAAAVAVPVAGAANDRVQLAGSFVAPGQVSEAQLNAGHDPATRMVQVGGALVAPAQVSAWQDGAGGSASADSTNDSSGIGTGGIAAIAALGSLVVLAVGSVVILRNRRKLVTA